MRRSDLLAPIAGLGFAAVLAVSTVFSPGGPNSNDPAARIAGYYAQHSHGDIASDYASMAATGLLLLVFCAAAARLRGTAGAVLLAAAAAAAIFELSATGIEMALAANVHSHAPASTTAALYQVASRFFMFSTLAIGAAVGIVAWTESRAWVRWLGLATALVLITAGLGAAHPHGTLAMALLPGWTLLLVWMVARSVAALRRPEVKTREALATS